MCIRDRSKPPHMFGKSRTWFDQTLEHNSTTWPTKMPNTITKFVFQFWPWKGFIYSWLPLVSFIIVQLFYVVEVLRRKLKLRKGWIFLPSHYVRFLSYVVYEITQTARFLLYHYISFQEFAVNEIKDLYKKRFCIKLHNKALRYKAAFWHFEGKMNSNIYWK